MTHEEAVDFLKKGIKLEQGTWLDLGAGNGIFSKALAELLLPDSKIYALDKDPSVLNISNPNPSTQIIKIQAAFNDLPDLPEFDGILMANVLHYVASPIPFLQNLLKLLRPNGSIVLVEYDMESSNPWVPYPIPFQKWKTISSEAGLSAPEIFNKRISRYRQGTIYAAINYLNNGEQL